MGRRPGLPACTSTYPYTCPHTLNYTSQVEAIFPKVDREACVLQTAVVPVLPGPARMSEAERTERRRARRRRYACVCVWMCGCMGGCSCDVETGAAAAVRVLLPSVFRLWLLHRLPLLAAFYTTSPDPRIASNNC